jgi:hypothetical protein
VRLPLLLVVPEAGFIVPQAPAGLPPTVIVTASPLTDVPLKVVTLIVNVSVVEPVAAMVPDAGVTVTTFWGAVWLIEMVVLAPDPASVAVITHVPTVVFTV